MALAVGKGRPPPAQSYATKTGNDSKSEGCEADWSQSGDKLCSIIILWGLAALLCPRTAQAAPLATRPSSRLKPRA